MGYRHHTLKSIIFLYTNTEQLENEILKQYHSHYYNVSNLRIPSIKNTRYLGTKLTKNV